MSGTQKYSEIICISFASLYFLQKMCAIELNTDAETGNSNAE